MCLPKPELEEPAALEKAPPGSPDTTQPEDLSSVVVQVVDRGAGEGTMKVMGRAPRVKHTFDVVEVFDEKELGK